MDNTNKKNLIGCLILVIVFLLMVLGLVNLGDSILY